MVCRFCGVYPFHSPDCLLVGQAHAPILFCSACGHLLVGAAYTRATEGRDSLTSGFCDSCARDRNSTLIATDLPEPGPCIINGEPVQLSAFAMMGCEFIDTYQNGAHRSNPTSTGSTSTQSFRTRR
jgi:hypothetical protein